ncbi:hypothetical protein MLD38_032708 [Melastoma candidum]|uniref:Uncharacterized protein n=1 Tax=Melastoma candidum TaxID=119954 RepID=A0ACB9M4K7_9MYRT|nr:hypothetical protein MLD38_032708 [Melastoma candidum]
MAAVMNRTRAILSSVRLANTALSSLNRSSPSLSRCEPRSHSLPLHGRRSGFSLGTAGFSTEPEAFLRALATKDWSKELQNASLKLSHETAVYVLRKLDDDPVKADAFFGWACGQDGFSPSSSLFSLLLRILGNRATIKEFWVALRKMKEQGFYLDEETFLTIFGIFKKNKMASDAVALRHFYERMILENGRNEVVRNLVEVILRKEWCDDVEGELAGLKVEFSENLVSRVLKELRNYPARAVGFFHWVGKSGGFTHNAVLYNAVARVLARDDSTSEFWSIVGEMRSSGHEMDVDTYIKVSRKFQNIKMMEDAVKLYEFMMDGPFKPSVQDCSLLLRTLSASDMPDLELVHRVVRKYESTGNSLSKAVYDGIHRSLAAAGRFDEAEQVMMDMKNAGHEPDNITYSQLVFGLCKSMRLEEACNVVAKMEGLGCLPDIKTWTILIQGHCRAGEIDKALLLFTKMVETDLDVDADLLDVMIKGFLAQRKFEGAYHLCIQVVDKARVRPWQATLKHLIEGLLEARKLDEAMNLLRLMKKLNYPPHSGPFDQYIARFGSIHDADEFLKTLSMKQYPSPAAYQRLFQAFFKEGRHSEAKDLLYKCPHHVRKDSKISELFGSTGADAV